MKTFRNLALVVPGLAILMTTAWAGPFKGPEMEVTSLRQKGTTLVASVTNNGPGDYKAGREWQLSYLRKDGAIVIFLRGDVPAMKGKASSSIVIQDLEDSKVLTTLLGSKDKVDFTFELTPRSSTPAKDSIKFTYTPPASQPDLEAAKVWQYGPRLAASVKNNGPGKSSPIGRTYTLTAAPGGVVDTGPIDAIAQGSDLTLQFPKADKLLTGNVRIDFTLTLSPGDSTRANDSAKYAYLPEKRPDLELGLIQSGANVFATIKTNGPGDYPILAGRTYTLTAVPGGPIWKDTQVSHIYVGTVMTLKVAIPNQGKEKVVFTFSLSPGDSTPANDTARLTYVPAAKK